MERAINRIYTLMYIQTHTDHAMHRDGMLGNILKYIY